MSSFVVFPHFDRKMFLHLTSQETHRYPHYYLANLDLSDLDRTEDRKTQTEMIDQSPICLRKSEIRIAAPRLLGSEPLLVQGVEHWGQACLARVSRNRAEILFKAPRLDPHAASDFNLQIPSVSC